MSSKRYPPNSPKLCQRAMRLLLAQRTGGSSFSASVLHRYHRNQMTNQFGQCTHIFEVGVRPGERRPTSSVALAPIRNLL